MSFRNQKRHAEAQREILFCLILAVIPAHAAVVSRDWSDGKLTLKLDDGAAEIEWISQTSFRFARSWNGALPAEPLILHERVAPAFEDTASALSMKTRYLTVEVDRADVRVRLRSGDAAVTEQSSARTPAGIEVRLALKPEERIFGLLGGSAPRLNLRGEALERRQGFFLTSSGYGMLVRFPESARFDFGAGTIAAPGASAIDYIVYYGPTAKEILEQHATFHPQNEVKAESLDLLTRERLPKQATPLPSAPVRSWDAFAALIRTMNHWSLSAILHPALDLAIFDSAPREVKRRASDLASIFPLIFRSSGEGGIDPATREQWMPYLVTYLREAYDRGYPLIRPLPMQFSRDSDSDREADVFMLGDEVLVAPVVAPGAKRRLYLPRGNWTDLRTNIEYRGRAPIEVDAPPGRVPMFVRNGWIVPLEMSDRMELHYFPSLGAEFFLWEPDINDNSQFHAAPAGDFVRLEIESQKRRTYEWVLHHMKAPREVAEESGAYRPVNRPADLKPGTWWHDAAGNNLHLMLRAEARTDRIVNISF